MDYAAKVLEDAKDCAVEFLDAIVERLCDEGAASTDLLNDYPDGDGYHHQNHTDQEYDLLEAAQILDTLSDHEETDSGLWEGCEPRKAISAQAAYTYANAVMAKWQEVIEDLNDDDTVKALCEAYSASETDGVKELIQQAMKVQVANCVAAFNG